MRIVAMAAALLVPAGAQAQITPEQAAIIKDDPAAAPQRLELVDLPRATGPARDLFNGRDLAGWAPWLGYADTALTFRPQTVAPLGVSIDTGEIFAVETVDGGPVIRAGGRYWGSLATIEDFADYHLSLEYRWGELREGEQRNNGLVYFSHGSPGAVFGTWMTGIEFQLEHGSNGMAIPMGNAVRTHVTIAQDKSVRYPYRVFRIGGREIDLANGNPAYSVEHASDAEKPVGTWNRIDLYVVGDQAVQVVNGVPVMELRDIAELDAAGARLPLTRGRIQLQSEGAVTYFRNIRIEPIRTLPGIREVTGS
ncbi:MAG: DUF1080 domain-containing protein [Pseudomonadota bacterium]